MKKIISLFFRIVLLSGYAGNLFAAIDLKVTANPDPVLPNERVAYELTVTNTGNTAVTGVVVEDLFSGSVVVNYLHIADGGACPVSTCQTGERITWNIGTLAAHTSHTVRYEAAVRSNTPAGTVISNLTELFSNSGNASVLTSIDVVSAPGLELSISDDRDPVVPGDQLTYTVVFGNRSTNVLGVKLRAPLPAGTSFVSASPGGSVVGGAVEWDLGTVLANAVGERRFTVRVDAVAVAGDAVLAEAQLVNGTTVQTLVRAGEVTALAAATPVELHVTANPDPVLPNERVAYELTVTNTGNLPVTGVVLKDLFPAFVNVNYLHIADGGVCPVSTCQTGERITWTIGTLAAHTSHTVRFEALVNNSADAGTVLDNVATLVTDVGRATARTAVVVGAGPGLELSISDDRDPVVPGDQLTYTVVFGNRAASTPADLALEVPVPAGTSFVSATAAGKLVNGVVTWRLGDRLISGGVDKRHFTVRVNGAAVPGGAIHADARLVDATTIRSLVRAKAVTEITAAIPAVRLTAVASSDQVIQNAINYTLTVTNTSALPVTGVVVMDLFPQFVSVSSAKILDGGTCPVTTCQTGERITWTVGTLAAHSSQSLRYQLTKNASLDNGTVLRNLASVKYDVGTGSSQLDLGVGIVIDSDEDGLPDSWELQHFGNLNQGPAGDFDSDGLSNLDEYWYRSDPKDSDTDNDGMPDGFEGDYNLNPLSAADAARDADGDGLSNLREFQLGTNPRNRDTDGDGMPDKYEVDQGFNPLSSADASVDADSDGFSNLAEYRAGSDPLDPASIPKRRFLPWLPLLLG